MLRSRFYDYSHAYVLAKGTIKITGARDNDAAERAEKKN